MKKVLAVTVLLCTSPFAMASTNSATCSESLEWQDSGFEMGSKGKAATEFYALAKQCNGNVSQTEEAAFVKGYMAGIQTFCNYENGFELGKENASVPNVCPKSMLDEIAQGYKDGKAHQDRRLNDILSTDTVGIVPRYNVPFSGGR